MMKLGRWLGVVLAGVSAGTASAQSDPGGLAIAAKRFYRAEVGTTVEAFCRVPFNLLERVQGGSDAFGAYRVTIVVRDSTGLGLTEQTWAQRVPAQMLAVPGASSVEQFRFAVPAGRYSVNVVVTDSASGRVVRSSVPVEGFDTPPLVSDLLLTSVLRAAGDSAVAGGGEFLRGGFLITAQPEPVLTPTQSRLFYYAELYPGQAVEATLLARVRTRDGREVIATPPDKNGHVNAYILAVANLLKVNEIYKMGGAQAIAALSFGTKTIQKVDKIIGPGNMYVTEAKRQLFGYVDIDMLAGPTELVIIANRHSNPQYVLADLEAQAEHLGGLAVLVTTSKQLIKQVRTKIANGYIIYAKNIDEAIDITNKIAPEHLEILTNPPTSVAKKIRNAAAIFLGPYSPTALGDYAAGPSHVLPTLGTARFFSGICLSDFMKKSHIISYSKRALEKMKEPIEKIAKLEGLPKHYESVNIRFQH